MLFDSDRHFLAAHCGVRTCHELTPKGVGRCRRKRRKLLAGTQTPGEITPVARARVCPGLSWTRFHVPNLASSSLPAQAPPSPSFLPALAGRRRLSAERQPASAALCRHGGLQTKHLTPQLQDNSPARNCGSRRPCLNKFELD